MKGASIERLLAFLNPKGPREGVLLQRLHRAGFVALHPPPPPQEEQRDRVRWAPQMEVG